MENHATQRNLILQTQRDYAASTIAALTWITWDSLISLGDEVQHLWIGHVKWIQWLYAVIRYALIIYGWTQALVLFNVASTCRVASVYDLVFFEGLTIAIDIILVVRVLILYKTNTALKGFILVTFAAEVVGMTIFIGFVNRGVASTPDCISGTSPKIFIGHWLTSLIFETFVFVLTLVKCYRSALEKVIAARRSVLFLFLRDGTWAFALIFLVILLNVLMYRLISTPLITASIGYDWGIAALSFSGSHYPQH